MSNAEGSRQTFGDWRAAVDRRLFEVYGITIDDAGIEHQQLSNHWEENEPPNDFVEWFGLKYDLDPKAVFGL